MNGRTAGPCEEDQQTMRPEDDPFPRAGGGSSGDIDQFELFEPEEVASAENKNDGGEPTPPSREEKPIAKSESPCPPQNTTSRIPVTSKASGDIFDDLNALGRIAEDLTPSEKVLASLGIRKPKKDEWIRTHATIHTPVNIYEQSTTKDTYLVLQAALGAMERVVKHVRLRLAVNYHGEPFIWPVAVPTIGQSAPCYVTATAAAATAENNWIRIGWNAGDYEVHRRVSVGKEPYWPSVITNPSEMLRFASKSGSFEIIDSPDHPVVRELLGLA